MFLSPFGHLQMSRVSTVAQKCSGPWSRGTGTMHQVTGECLLLCQLSPYWKPGPNTAGLCTVSFPLWGLYEGRRQVWARERERREVYREGGLVFLEYLVEFHLPRNYWRSHFTFLGCTLCSYLKSPYFHIIPSQIKKHKTTTTKNDFLGVSDFI